jgi:hypothetical protein
MGLAGRISGTAFVTAVLLACAMSVQSAEPADLLSMQRADIAVFREQFLKVDRAFTRETMKQAEQRLTRLERAPRALSPLEFSVELCRVAALADNAHTVCIPAEDARFFCEQIAILEGDPSANCAQAKPDFEVPELNRIALRFYPFGTDFHVTSAPAADADLLGARLVAVDGKPIRRVLPIVRSFSGGTIPYRDLNATGILASPNQLHAVKVTRTDNAVTYTFVTQNKRTIERTFNVEKPAADAPRVSLPPPDRVPWAFQERDKNLRWRDAPELDAVFIQVRQNLDDGEQKIGAFLEDAESNRVRLGRQNVVLDMRSNGGGNLMLTRGFMNSWPARLAEPGRFFALTSRQTMSAGIASIAYLKQAGKDRVVLVGEAPGDRLMFFSEARPIQLPHSGLFFGPTTARQDFHTGCRNYDDCFVGVTPPGHAYAPLMIRGIKVEDIAREPIAIASLEPDIAAPWTIESWLNGTDPALEALLQRHRD